MKAYHRYLTLALTVLLGASAGYVAAAATESVDFSDTQAQAARFMKYHEEIELTAEQEAIKKEALEALPAACCSDNTAYTCCCPCNLSRTVWGLSNYLIAEQGADAGTVRSEVERWYATVNPDGFPGNSCYTGRCGKPFADGGCGGMNPARLAWGS